MSSKAGGRLRELVLNVAGLAIGCLLALGLLEVLLRFYNPFQARIKGDRIVLETNKKYTIKNDIIDRLEPEIRVERNALGFRGPNPPADMAQALSVITIGGSTTQCFFLSEGKTWTDKIAADLGPRFRNLWVNNAGLDGHSSYGHLVLLEDHVVRVKPKFAVLLVGANDMGRDPGAEWDSENVKSSISWRSPTAFVKSLSPYSEVASLLANLYRSMNAYKRGLMHQKVDLTKLPLRDFSPEEVKAYRESVLRKSYLDGFGDRLQRIVTQARAAGIEPVLMTQPVLLGAGKDDRTGVDLERVLVGEGATANGKMWWEAMETYNDVTRKVGRDNGVQVIDMARKLPKTSLYFYDTIHFSGEGAAAVGAIAAAELCEPLAKRYPGFVASACPAAATAE